MSAVDTVEALLSLGVTVKDAYTKASTSGSMNWSAFLASPDFAAIQKDVSGLLAKLTSNDVTSALSAVQTKKQSLLGGQSVSALSSDKLTQYFALLSAEGLLVTKELENAKASAAFFEWLVTSALPTLVSIAKVVIPLLV
jgi:hypothetical protein